MYLSKEKKKFKETGEVYLRIKAKPGAARSLIKDIMDDGTIKIDIAAKPTRGQANQELIKFLAKEFAASPEKIKIISGKNEKIKLIKMRL